MEDRIDFLNRSFHEQRGLLPQETFEGLPAGIVPSISVSRDYYKPKEGASLLFAHAANLHIALHHPTLVKPCDHVIITRTPVSLFIIHIIIYRIGLLMNMILLRNMVLDICLVMVILVFYLMINHLYSFHSSFIV